MLQETSAQSWTDPSPMISSREPWTPTHVKSCPGKRWRCCWSLPGSLVDHRLAAAFWKNWNTVHSKNTRRAGPLNYQYRTPKTYSRCVLDALLFVRFRCTIRDIY